MRLNPFRRGGPKWRDPEDRDRFSPIVEGDAGWELRPDRTFGRDERRAADSWGRAARAADRQKRKSTPDSWGRAARARDRQARRNARRFGDR